ncbi:hypothetical protein CS006_10365 [Bifidobacterium primatium]|uniref:Uncharacterized protein n=1 Tax=Bifidobacterium primatium TaxID=2045438 RepID=A0A2M9H684_9BIFI|nr:hypothetical protein [Bifidobacterium primatium]PJM72332.1 hypothetical protein CS006_10365 [Bifidobacterium primatium]
MGYQLAWELTRELLRDHTSASYAALAGWAYTPTGAETAMWDRLELEGLLKKRGYRPWKDRRNDTLRAHRLEDPRKRRERLARRQRLKDRYHITE